MTRQEFKAWSAVTAGSAQQWTLDSIRLFNNGEYFFYKGGAHGKYVIISKDGNFEMGFYEGAIPHIGEASFEVHLEKKFASREEAYQYILTLSPQFYVKELCQKFLDALVGKEIKFSAEPYHYGKAVIKGFEDHTWDGYICVQVRTTDAQVTSRLFAATRNNPFNNQDLLLYPFTLRDVQDAVNNGDTLRHVYSV